MKVPPRRRSFITFRLSIFVSTSFCMAEPILLDVRRNPHATSQFNHHPRASAGLSPGGSTFSVTYADNHSAGTIVANLMEVDSCSSTERQICSVTSSDGDGSTHCDTCSLNSTIDFSNHAYYVYVTITKTDLPADPRL